MVCNEKRHGSSAAAREAYDIASPKAVGNSVEIKMLAHPVPTINKIDASTDWLSSLKRSFGFNARVRQK
jgi:hypothetical protein